MSNKKKQYYVVVNGRQPGIYSRWFGVGEAAEQVEGFPEAVYRGFYSREEALDWLQQFPDETLQELAPNLHEYKEEKDALPTTSESIKELLKTEKVLIFTDGSARGNPGAGGYGVILKYKNHVKESFGGFSRTTNNRMEIMACIEGLRMLKQPSDVVIFTDSQYIVNGISKGWVKRWQAQGWVRKNQQAVVNSDLWEQLLESCSRHTVEFRWFRGHAGVKENERCDRLAKMAAQKINLPSDPGYVER